MEYYFAKDFAGSPFELFKVHHLSALAMVLMMILFLIFLRLQKNQRLNNSFRWSLAVLLVLQEISFHMWNIHIGEWTLQTMLPFQICTLFVWLSAYMLATKNRPIYEFAFFLSISGAVQALMTPDIAGYGFPHYRFFHVFVSHGSLVLASLYMTLVEGFRPYWRSIGKVMLWLNVYAVFIFVLNSLLGSNYMFIARKPETASLLDLLGPWPVYVFAAEGVALIMFLMFYLPFALYDWRFRIRTRFIEISQGQEN